MKKLFALFIFLPIFSDAQIITTFAGSRVATYGGDGGPATAALLNLPSGVVVDASGNTYIADLANNRIRMISASGMITTIAGNDTAAYVGDGGPASAAEVSGAGGIAIDASGNIYIADGGNDVIRKINTSGIISTVAGIGYSYGFSGDGGAATAALMNQPSGVAVDASGNIYVADWNNGRVRKVDVSGIITTFAGTGASGYSGDGGMATDALLRNPAGVAVDASGNVYIADEFNGCIRKVNNTGIITTIAGNGTLGYSGDGGPAVAAELYQPTSISVDASGNVFIADQVNNRIRKINASGVITTVSGSSAGGFSGDNGPATAALLYAPACVYVDAMGNVFIADESNNRVREINTSGVIKTIAGDSPTGHGDGGPATAAQISEPFDIAFDAVGNVYIADWNNNLIRKVDTSGVISTVAGNGVSGFSGDGGLATAASLHNPAGIAVDNYGDLYISDDDNDCIRKVNTAGIISTICGGSGGHYGDGGPATAAGITVPMCMVIDRVGNLYFSESNEYVRKIDTAGIISTVAGNGDMAFYGDGGPATAAALNNNVGVAVDNIGNIYIADYLNHRIRKVDTAGIISTIAGNGTPGYSGDGGPASAALLNYPAGISVDNAGNLFVSDEQNNSVRKIDPTGIITTITGDGTQGYDGDGGLATAAQMYSPIGAKSDNMGHLYIIDYGNNVIRKVIGLPATPFHIASIAGADTVCEGATVSLSDSTTYGAWSTSGAVATVGTDGTVTGVTSGTAVITYTDGGTYTTTIVNVVSCSSTTGLLSATPADAIILYPNPATTLLTIQSTGTAISQVIITNVMGQTVYSQLQTVNCKLIKADISELAAGVYAARVNGKYVQKFVKE